MVKLDRERKAKRKRGREGRTRSNKGSIDGVWNRCVSISRTAFEEPLLSFFGSILVLMLGEGSRETSGVEEEGRAGAKVGVRKRGEREMFFFF